LDLAYWTRPAGSEVISSVQNLEGNAKIRRQGPTLVRGVAGLSKLQIGGLGQEKTCKSRERKNVGGAPISSEGLRLWEGELAAKLSDRTARKASGLIHSD